jgi:hypothetical protein
MNTRNSWHPLTLLYRTMPALAACSLLVAPWAGSAAATSTAADAPVAASAEAPAAAHWRTQKIDLTYSGFTAAYSCDGIEGKVKEILLSFGARKDVKVRATGCEQTYHQMMPSAPSKVAFVDTEFSTLVPGPDPAGGDTVQASWGKVQLAPGRPNFMGTGECELVDELRTLLEKGFTLRAVEYRTDCVPKHVSVGDYSVRAEVLRLAAH